MAGKKRRLTFCLRIYEFLLKFEKAGDAEVATFWWCFMLPVSLLLLSLTPPSCQRTTIHEELKVHKCHSFRRMFREASPLCYFRTLIFAPCHTYLLYPWCLLHSTDIVRMSTPGPLSFWVLKIVSPIVNKTARKKHSAF